MKNNVNLFEWVYLRFFSNKNSRARIEIISDKDLSAKNLKPLAKRVAETLVEKHPDLKIINLYRTDDLWNYNHPFIFLTGGFKGYVITIQRDYDLCSLKRTCMALELDEDASRIADIDIYTSPFEKISRKDLLDSYSSNNEFITKSTKFPLK